MEDELIQLRSENNALKEEAAKMIADLEKLDRSHREQELALNSMKEQLESKTRLCLDSEVSIAHFVKTLDDLRTNFEGAKINASQVMQEND